MQLHSHPIANIFPLLDGQEATSLASSIREHGQREDILLFEGKILDGRNRYAACQKIGVEPRTKHFNGSFVDALHLVWDLNFERRHLTASQSACADAERAKLLGAYQAVQEDARRRQFQGRPKTAVEVPQLIGEDITANENEKRSGKDAKKEAKERETVSIRAKAAKTNRTYIEAADDLLENHPDKFQEVKEGKKTITQVQREIKKEELAEKVVAPLEGKYRVIYADPPWKYGDQQAISKDGVTESYGPADAHYPQMTIDELCLLPVKEVAEDNAVLFLWVTSPLLESSFKIINSWGFKYKSSFVWDKVKHNMGHYNSVRHELLLIATKGSCLPDVKKLHNSVQRIERSDKHSEKPQEFRAIIDEIYPNGSRVELFARARHDGWNAWGNEA
jgi:N6-adenosine-specific RNA methylase IME4/ParB-like chromosome segregation protein Spo0J